MPWRTHRACLMRCVLVVLMTCPAASLFCQMYGNQTVYTESDGSTGTLHAWGYTYAPSGSSVVHTYSAQVNIVLPGGRSTTSSASASDLIPAQADAYMSITSSDSDGPVSIWTSHLAFCPYYAQGMNPFLDSTTQQVGISLAFTTLQTVNDDGKGTCTTTPDCQNNITPKCTSNTVTEVGGGPCHPFHYCGYIVVTSGTSYGCYLGICWPVVTGPGPCTPK